MKIEQAAYLLNFFLWNLGFFAFVMDVPLKDPDTTKPCVLEAYEYASKVKQELNK